MVCGNLQCKVTDRPGIRALQGTQEIDVGCPRPDPGKLAQNLMDHMIIARSKIGKIKFTCGCGLRHSMKGFDLGIGEPEQLECCVIGRQHCFRRERLDRLKQPVPDCSRR